MKILALRNTWRDRSVWSAFAGTKRRHRIGRWQRSGKRTVDLNGLQRLEQSKEKQSTKEGSAIKVSKVDGCTSLHWSPLADECWIKKSLDQDAVCNDFWEGRNAERTGELGQGP
ncbi:hypothetical protein HPP92_005052 [Vanilla planifolia]|uniref:Uncharacterized protein n=1 Tax=Vanilla planifolia TaxID=51239 RepID=A0A835RM92_VANPL|nr:hypothetical protein HPP92_005052 [Vanilla planifolia]